MTIKSPRLKRFLNYYRYYYYSLNYYGYYCLILLVVIQSPPGLGEKLKIKSLFLLVFFIYLFLFK